jgi:septal ring factor EnvC (AmiA/AmiB activator)
LNENEWNVRVEQVNKLSKDMARAEKRVEGYTKDQRMIRRDVNDLKRRLGKLREKREAREEWVRVHGMMGAGDHDDLAGKKDD